MDSDYQYLLTHRQIWAKKPILRQLYQEQIYRPIFENMLDADKTLEIGSGPGFMEEFAPDIIRSDIIPSPWINCVLDAHELPFPDQSLNNVVGIDVLHHFNSPIKMLQEIARVLRPNGRLILVEPWISPFSRFIYTYLHQEECRLDIQPWLEQNQFEVGKKAFDGNAAIPYVLLKEGKTFLEESLPNLHLSTLKPYSFMTYLLSGGFKSFNLLPKPLYSTLYAFEKLTEPLWVNFAALRALLIWEKQ